MAYPYVYKSQYQFSAPAPTSSGRYYWTNTYYWGSDFSSAPSDAMFNRLNLLALNSISEGCLRERWRVESALGTGDYYSELVSDVPGHISGTDRVLLIDSVLLYSGSATRGGWYKPLRGLLRAGDIVGGYVGSYIADWVATYLLPVLNSPQLLNYLGKPVGTVVLSPRVHGWQLRHGTKRSARRVLTS